MMPTPVSPQQPHRTATMTASQLYQPTHPHHTRHLQGEVTKPVVLNPHFLEHSQPPGNQCIATNSTSHVQHAQQPETDKKNDNGGNEFKIPLSVDKPKEPTQQQGTKLKPAETFFTPTPKKGNKRQRNPRSTQKTEQRPTRRARSTTPASGTRRSSPTLVKGARRSLLPDTALISPVSDPQQLTTSVVGTHKPQPGCDECHRNAAQTDPSNLDTPCNSCQLINFEAGQAQSNCLIAPVLESCVNTSMAAEMLEALRILNPPQPDHPSQDIPPHVTTARQPPPQSPAETPAAPTSASVTKARVTYAVTE